MSVFAVIVLFIHDILPFSKRDVGEYADDSDEMLIRDQSAVRPGRNESPL